jgi:uncharacterized Zn-finger protein
MFHKRSGRSFPEATHKKTVHKTSSQQVSFTKTTIGITKVMESVSSPKYQLRKTTERDLQSLEQIAEQNRIAWLQEDALKGR